MKAKRTNSTVLCKIGKYIGNAVLGVVYALCFICSRKLTLCVVLCERKDGARGKAGIHNRERERERERERGEGEGEGERED